MDEKSRNYSSGKEKELQNSRKQALEKLTDAAGHYQQLLNDICQKYELTNEQYEILRLLKAEHPKGLSRKKIINNMTERNPDVTRILDRIIKQDLAYRTESKEDKRLSIAKISDEGLQLLEKMEPEFERLSKSFIEGLSSSDLEQLTEICNTLITNFRLLTINKTI